jgi:hypothetical protein
VNGSLPANAPVTVAAGGRLSGTGTIADTVNIGPGSFIAPGTSSGTLTTGPLTVAPGGEYEWELTTAGQGNVSPNTGGSTTGGGVHDQLVVNGNLVLDGAVVRAFPISFTGFDPAQSYSWRLATVSGSISFAGATVDASQFFVAPGAGEFTLGTGGGMLFLNFTPIPEPGLVLLVAAGAAAIGVARRRRRSGASVGA